MFYYKNQNEIQEDMITLESVLKTIVEINEGRTNQPSDIAKDSLEFQLTSILKSICHAMYELELENFRYRTWEALEMQFEAIRCFKPHGTD